MRYLPARLVGNVVAARERGATAIEYGVMVALIAAVIISTVTVLGGNLSSMFNRIVIAL
ncbi:Flp family type IVb pilin [Staphylococcus aureus]|jgi:pilus assembly protein Flp/PilA|uniref:Flp family type IVb pilin n=1 Tax=Staphylococcus aureus TaxID=1280 RepID=UPI001AC192D2|nr:Flp family type IVb pilin [Propionibacteriaceae bacterium]